MGSWRDAILDDFVPKVSKLTLVADPDSLLSEEKLAQALRCRGFELIEFNDPIEFRYAYESKYRSIWDRGKHTDLVVILRLQDSKLDALPYDLLKAGRKLAFDLGGLFPNLSYPVIETLDRSLLDDLFEAQQKASSERMGDNATKDFILRHVYGIAAELLDDEVDLLRALLRLHYNQIRLPNILSERLVQVLRVQKNFFEWPLEEIVPRAEAFYAFLQERWPIFLDSLGTKSNAKVVLTDKELRYAGPVSIPFDHQDILVYIDNLFVEGKLTPVQKPDLQITEAHAWVRSGIAKIAVANDESRAFRLLELVEKTIPNAETRYSDWLVFALKWAELNALLHGDSLISDKARIRQVGEAINLVFAKWLKEHYASLINLPPTNPAMLHQVPRRLARELEASSDAKVALIVVDGLALDQWISVRHLLQEQDQDLVLREAATFAWIPTITSVSRQAIFSGKPPIYYPSSINTTNNEGNLWRQFWEEVGLSRPNIVYQRGLGDGDVASILDGTLIPGKTKAIGLVVDKVDKIMHGMQLGSDGMHNQIKQWCRGGFLGSLISYLLEKEYQVWLTSDHGNIECQGRGRLTEGAIADTRGERVRVYPTPELRTSVATTLDFVEEWQPVGLPADYYPLIAEGRSAFINEKENIVGHGGITLEEVIVPLIKFERRPL